MSVKSGTALLFAVSLGLVPSMAYAADTPSKAPLAPGGAAGVKAAEYATDNTLLLVGGGALVVGGVALVLSGGGHGHTSGSTAVTGTSR